MKVGTIASPCRYDVATGIAKGYPGFAPPSRKTLRRKSAGRRPADGSSHLQCRNGLDLLSKLLLGALKVVPLLQIEPEIGTVSAQLPEPQCHDRRYRLPFLENVVERLPRHAEQFGYLRLRPMERRQNLLAQKFAGMHGRQAAFRELLGHRTCPQ